MSDETTMPFDFSNGGTPSIIKVIGVGGGAETQSTTCTEKVSTT